jgi:hypothetical protein
MQSTNIIVVSILFGSLLISLGAAAQRPNQADFNSDGGGKSGGSNSTRQMEPPGSVKSDGSGGPQPLRMQPGNAPPQFSVDRYGNTIESRPPSRGTTQTPIPTRSTPPAMSCNVLKDTAAQERLLTSDPDAYDALVARCLK